MVRVAGSTACACARGTAELCLKLEMRSARIELFDIVNVQMNWTRHCATASPLGCEAERPSICQF